MTTPSHAPSRPLTVGTRIVTGSVHGWSDATSSASATVTPQIAPPAAPATRNSHSARMRYSVTAKKTSKKNAYQRLT
ncbi:hypothetical protein ET445_07445 [Agromyces protaetiae]|uniref:Uncharacterized protein n=1 Tax=Agromyces protaetiae TaxID=2509455 RepID=A0A4P6FRQ4_9MICO|nr:hypothetical protein [Agromyces protaetiae]QAY73208.1 hypothetical protein ET445_07445 [Agromyces protaetiae]